MDIDKAIEAKASEYADSKYTRDQGGRYYAAKNGFKEALCNIVQLIETAKYRSIIEGDQVMPLINYLLNIVDESGEEDEYEDNKDDDEEGIEQREHN